MWEKCNRAVAVDGNSIVKGAISTRPSISLLFEWDAPFVSVLACVLCSSWPEKSRRDHSFPEGTYAFKWAERMWDADCYTERRREHHSFCVCVCVFPPGRDRWTLFSYRSDPSVEKLLWRCFCLPVCLSDICVHTHIVHTIELWLRIVIS